MADKYEFIKVLISGVTAFLAVIGGAVAIVNFLRTTHWKRAELANKYLEDLSSNEELVFACRALDWNGGKLVVPEKLRPIVRNGSN